MTFKIKPTKKESENKTIRFPSSTLERIDAAIRNQDVTFSSFVIQACEYALDHMEPPTGYVPNETPSVLLETSD